MLEAVYFDMVHAPRGGWSGLSCREWLFWPALCYRVVAPEAQRQRAEITRGLRRPGLRRPGQCLGEWGKGPHCCLAILLGRFLSFSAIPLVPWPSPN